LRDRLLSFFLTPEGYRAILEDSRDHASSPSSNQGSRHSIFDIPSDSADSVVRSCSSTLMANSPTTSACIEVLHPKPESKVRSLIKVLPAGRSPAHVTSLSESCWKCEPSKTFSSMSGSCFRTSLYRALRLISSLMTIAWKRLMGAPLKHCLGCFTTDARSDLAKGRTILYEWLQMSVLFVDRDIAQRHSYRPFTVYSKRDCLVRPLEAASPLPRAAQ
jgi:hypothetical protein